MIDLINSLFISGAIIAAYLDLRQVWRDRAVRGITAATSVLFTMWPVWDLYYYHCLGQFVSMFACLVLVCMRATWAISAWYFTWES